MRKTIIFALIVILFISINSFAFAIGEKSSTEKLSIQQLNEISKTLLIENIKDRIEKTKYSINRKPTIYDLSISIIYQMIKIILRLKEKEILVLNMKP